MQSTRPPAPDAREPEPEPEIKLEASPVRCPYCHDGIDVADEAWVACAGCLARHHEACWAESAACGSCGHAERLTRAGASAPRRVQLRLDGERDTVTRLPVVGPRGVIHEREFAGEVEVGALRDWLTAEVRRVLGVQGLVEVLRDPRGERLRWTAVQQQRDGCGGGGGQIELTSGGGRTWLRIEMTWTQLLGGVLGGIGGGLGGGGLGGLGGVLLPALGLPPQALALIAPLWLLLVFALAIALYRRLATRAGQKVATLTQRLTQGLEGPAERTRSDPKAG